MPDYRTSTTIARPIAEVFAYISDVTTWSSWMNLESMQPMAPDGLRVGARADGTLREGSQRMPFSMEITELDPGRRIGFRTLSGPIDWAGNWELSAVDENTTRVNANGSMRLRGIRRLLEPLMAGEVRRSEAAELTKLRALLEGEPSTAG